MIKKAGFITLMLVLTFSLALVGCNSKEPVGNTKEPVGNTKELTGNIKLAGSTSVQPLAEELAMKYMEQHKQVKVDVAGGGSGVGIESAVNGSANIGMASRDLKQAEKDATPTLKTIVIAQDGISVVINPRNSVSNLTLAQIQDIFTGKVTNWKMVGGNDVNITVVNREEGSGTRGAFEEIVLKGAAYTDKAIIQNSTGAIKTAVVADVNAIGYISMGSMSADVKGVQVNGIAPTTDNVVKGTYPISRPFNFLVKGDPNEVTKSFIDWILAEGGQKIVTDQGYISIK